MLFTIRLSCFGSENKMEQQSAEHFTRFTANYCLKTAKIVTTKTTRRTSAIWGISANLNSLLSSKLPDTIEMNFTSRLVSMF